MLAMSLKFHILKLGTLMLYIMELVSQNVQKIAKISGQLLEGVSRPRVWFMGLINTTYWPLLSNEYLDWQYTWLDYKINILGLFSNLLSLHGALYIL